MNWYSLHETDLVDLVAKDLPGGLSMECDSLNDTDLLVDLVAKDLPGSLTAKDDICKLKVDLSVKHNCLTLDNTTYAVQNSSEYATWA
jgi:hypothetical protein